MSNNANSFYDSGQIFKEVHDLHGKTLRVQDSRSVVDRFYTHFRVEYTAENLPTQVSYYRGTQSHRTELGCVSDSSGSLQNKYIKIFAGPDNKAFHLWLNVSGEGVAPIVIDSTPIEIPINFNDDATVVSMAISLVINTLFKEFLYANRTNSTVEITSVGMGSVSNSQDFGTGFLISNNAGKQELISKIEIKYDGVHPIYKGQVLKNYIFNVFTGQFELKEDLNAAAADVSWDEISTTFPEENKELYTYKKNTTPVQEVLVTYVDGSKKQIVSIQKTRL
jgi:hypothetical protein